MFEVTNSSIPAPPMGALLWVFSIGRFRTFRGEEVLLTWFSSQLQPQDALVGSSPILCRDAISDQSRRPMAPHAQHRAVTMNWLWWFTLVVLMVAKCNAHAQEMLFARFTSTCFNGQHC
jgi:hypothetical protein